MLLFVASTPFSSIMINEWWIISVIYWILLFITISDKFAFVNKLLSVSVPKTIDVPKKYPIAKLFPAESILIYRFVELKNTQNRLKFIA